MCSVRHFFNSPQSEVSNNASPKIFCNARSCPLRELKSKMIYLGHANTDDKYPVLPLCWCHGGCLSLLGSRWFSPDGETALWATHSRSSDGSLLTSRTEKIVCASERERMSHSVLNSLSTNHGQVLLNSNEVQCPRELSQEPSSHIK